MHLPLYRLYCNSDARGLATVQQNLPTSSSVVGHLMVPTSTQARAAVADNAA